MNPLKFLTPEPVLTAKCRWCNSLFEYTATERPAWPCMCWRCSDATEQRYQALPKRRPEPKAIAKL